MTTIMQAIDDGQDVFLFDGKSSYTTRHLEAALDAGRRIVIIDTQLQIIGLGTPGGHERPWIDLLTGDTWRTAIGLLSLHTHPDSVADF